MRDTTVARRAAALARNASEEEAVANLAAGYETMMRTAKIAKEHGDARFEVHFRRRARRYLAGLRLIVRGANAIRVYERVTGSCPWIEK